MLKQRAITAVLALAILGIVVFVLPLQIAILVIAALLVAGAWEWSGFLDASRSTRFVFVALLTVLMGILHWWLSGSVDQSIVAAFATIWWLFAFIWTFFFPTPIARAVRWLCGALVIVPLAIVLPAMLARSPELLLFVLLIVWAADIGAYFAGKKFGRVKLAPAISPGKTWEGVIGGLLAVSILAVAGARYFGIELLVLWPFCLAVAAISIVGDLTVSMFKRTAGVKDSGKLFPGHGGVLDRIDSISAAAPVFMLGLPWLGVW